MQLCPLGSNVLLLPVLVNVAAIHAVPLIRRDLADHKDAPTPANFVINCQEDDKRLQRFKSHMEKAGMEFEVFSCLEPSLEDVQKAVHEGYLSSQAEKRYDHHAGFLGVGLSHMKLLQTIIDRGLPSANIFEDDEVVPKNYKEERNRVLTSLPPEAEFINLNPLRPNGDPVKDADPRVHRLHSGLPGNANVWFSNYYVTAAGAKRLLEVLKGFDAGASSALEIDWQLADAFTGYHGQAPSNGFFSLTTNALSTHCETQSTKARRNQDSSMRDFAAPPVCFE